MNTPPERQELIDDVIAEAAPADFPDVVLQTGLCSARRRRTRRRARITAIATLGVAAVIAGGIRWIDTKLDHQVQAITCNLVETRALPDDAIVRTVPFRGAVVSTRRDGVNVVTTRGGMLRSLDDGQLLALAGPDGAILVTIGPQRKQLVYANTDAR